MSLVYTECVCVCPQASDVGKAHSLVPGTVQPCNYSPPRPPSFECGWFVCPFNWFPRCGYRMTTLTVCMGEGKPVTSVRSVYWVNQASPLRRRYMALITKVSTSNLEVDFLRVCLSVRQLYVSLCTYSSIQRLGPVVITPVSYLGGPGFRSWPWDWLSWQACCGFPQFLQENAEMMRYITPRPFPFTFLPVHHVQILSFISL
jgi:hypothetical protein